MQAPTPPSSFEERRAAAHAALRTGSAQAAERWLRQLLAERDDVNCQWLLAVALLYQERVAESCSLLGSIVARCPDFIEARTDLARAERAAGRAQRGRAEVREVLERVPHHHRAWLAYGDILVDLRQYRDACIAYERAQLSDPWRGDIARATDALLADERRQAEEIFRAILHKDAAHVGALCGLAALSFAVDRPRDSERLLRHALRQSAHLPLAHRGLAPTLVALGRLQEAQAVAEYLTRVEPDSPQSWVCMASVATRMMRQAEALEAYRRAAELKPDEAGLYMSMGHAQKTLGQRTESERSYHAALALEPTRGEAYWSLADLKNYRFSDAELQRMQALLRDSPGPRANAAQLHFALGCAYEQRADYAEAFAHYAAGNALRRLDAPFDSDAFERRAARIRGFFSAERLRERRGQGSPDGAPIFIVGLPRSGSTLVEQILASHPLVEGTMELQNILNIVGAYDDQVPGRDGYPETLAAASPQALHALGERYLAETAPLHPHKPRFTDKLPNNFSHLGLLQLILPNATVIDARRHPMDACLSNFKQYFAQGQTFSYDLVDLGRYYQTYLAMMDHWDQVLPGKVLHVQYEELVREPERVIRQMLEHCQLPFHAGCLTFHETSRPVRTASAEQVRRPLYTSGVGYWRHFETQLAPLRAALGAALERFD
ncbi:MAG: sulfotransferase [Gammaproteobacteria bacterium]|nr:sulfotransferase [Gammaproteobacteria bacterium]